MKHRIPSTFAVGFALSTTAIAIAGSNILDYEPLPPVKPIQIRTDLGETASATDKLVVTLEITIDRNNVNRIILLRDLGVMGSHIKIDITEVEKFAIALEEASDSLLERRAFNKKAGNGLEISLDTISDEAVIRIKSTNNESLFSSGSIFLDADNAISISRLLNRGVRVNEWFVPHIESLKH